MSDMKKKKGGERQGGFARRNSEERGREGREEKIMGESG